MATTVRLSYEPGYGWSARHLPSGIASQGETEPDALRSLAEALQLYQRDEDCAVEASDEWYDRYEVSK
jgi:predicted RNase H-like HicB family nuclease